MKEIIDQYAPILEGKVDVADVKKKQKQLRLNGESRSSSKDKQSKPLPSLRKINDLDSTSNSSS